ncbi:MAG: prepilin-type N-terminal cleavage/methylation domain-containing protein, partial [Elusimicrobiaceae bacterium]|nr:prepilin-type N-terminal cleavage/methylation domain-containing protein [Elusimicrobiaceae bacterium]
MKKGFTLTELLVVVLIIGILSSAALPKYRRAVERAEMMEALTQGKTIYDSAVRYKSANGDAPTSFTQLDAILTGVNNSTGSAFQEGRFIYELHQNL